MGIIWRSTMPMLSTLAALVIIVHSAEEELDPGFRRDLRPRAVDPGTSYEQPWKAIDAEPLAQQSTHTDNWDDNSPEELTARRRPVRKRKRRPQTSSETEAEDRYREGSQVPYPDTDYHDSHQTTEFTRRRRKRPDVRPYRWADEPNETERERPLRRRGLRRKRPTFDSNPQLSEFNWNPKDDHLDDHHNTEQIQNYHEDERAHKQKSSQYLDSHAHINAGYNIDDSNEEVQNSTGRPKLPIFDEFGDWRGQGASEDHVKSEEKIHIDDNEHFTTKVYPEYEIRPKLSEFSMETINSKSWEKTYADGHGNFGSNSNSNTATEVTEKAKEHDPIDPYSLKQLLKKSNGTSLSEILQRHNLSLSDLLRGRGDAILALNKNASPEHQFEDTHHLQIAESQYNQQKQVTLKDINTTLRSDADEIETTEAPSSPSFQETNNNNTETERLESSVIKQRHVVDQPQIVSKRRFPTGIRRKLRMRPMLNSTLKAQLGRDLLALTARKYSRNNRTLSKSKEWKDVIPMMLNKSKSNVDTNGYDITEPVPTTTDASIETIVPDLEIVNSSDSLNVTETNVIDNEVEGTGSPTTEQTTTIIIEVAPAEIRTEKPIVPPIVRPVANNSALRNKSFNNRIKRKRLKQKSSTTENPNDDLSKKTFGVGNLVSASHFIERTQKPHTLITQGNTEYATELEDFLTTPVSTTENKVKPTRITTSRYLTTSLNKGPILSTTTSTTEQSAKFEIEEILNDTMTSERLERILRERNMTLNELVNHRERGSSHVHLADIFHNASKEPNPPEPFLTKSSIEPISKETYPLRAILEANIHDTTARSPTIDTTKAQGNDLHIPVVMDFGNNVNENGENMGIISLFTKLAENDESVEKTEIRQDSNGTPYLSSIHNVNATDTNDTKRESRVLGDDEDIDSWNALLALMSNQNLNYTKEDSSILKKGSPPIDKGKTSLEEDVDGDGLIILEDLQQLKDLDINLASASDEKLEIKMFETREKNTDKQEQGILNKFPSTTRSVAIATASILGLATILFLLTYVLLKLKQHRSPPRKKDSFCDDRIPSPVFEHRKGHKNHCSSRSISPMISNSNIYTMSTLDSHNGKESPDYMWNSLRKPFQ